jgi:hypothetical protein
VIEALVLDAAPVKESEPVPAPVSVSPVDTEAVMKLPELVFSVTSELAALVTRPVTVTV